MAAAQRCRPCVKSAPVPSCVLLPLRRHLDTRWNLVGSCCGCHHMNQRREAVADHIGLPGRGRNRNAVAGGRAQLWSGLSLAFTQPSSLQSCAQALLLCSLAVHPFAGMSQGSVWLEHHQVLTSVGAPPWNGARPLILMLNFLHCKWPFATAIAPRQYRQKHQARPACLATPLALLAPRRDRLASRFHWQGYPPVGVSEPTFLPLAITFGHDEHRGRAAHRCDDKEIGRAHV